MSSKGYQDKCSLVNCQLVLLPQLSLKLDHSSLITVAKQTCLKWAWSICQCNQVTSSWHMVCSLVESILDASRPRAMQLCANAAKEASISKISDTEWYKYRLLSRQKENGNVTSRLHSCSPKLVSTTIWKPSVVKRHWAGKRLYFYRLV